MDNNNQDEINRLITELGIQKEKDRKHQLKIEIAKATDRGVKRALQDILEDIEKKERRNKIIGLIVLVLLVLVGFFVVGVLSDKKDQTPIKTVTTNSTKTSESSTSESVEKVVQKEKNLTGDEVKQWVGAVWDKRNQNIPNAMSYELDVRIDDRDKLVYVRVNPPKEKQIDSLGGFRINANGELEESGYYVEGVGVDEWVVVSRKFMDLSEVKVKEAPKKVVEKKADVTSKQFAEIYAAYSKSEYPIMSLDEYSEKYGHLKEEDPTIQVLTHRDYLWEENVVECAIETPKQMPDFFFLYDNKSNRAYKNSYKDKREKEFLPELTDYVNNQR